MAQGGDQSTQSGTDMNGRGTHIRETATNEMIGSLGDALAGVNISQSTGSFGFEGGSETNGTVFASNGQQYMGQYPNNGQTNGGEGGGLSWGSPAFSAGSSSGFPGANSMPGMGGTPNGEQVDVQGSSLLAASGSTVGGSYSDPEQQQAETDNNLLFRMQNLGSEPTTPVRKKSLELFLSQSPSKTLGGDLLKLNAGTSAISGTDSQTMPRSGSAFSLDEMGRAPGQFPNGSIASASTETRQTHDPTIRRSKAESPSCSVTGTSASSRSASPYANDVDARRIQAFAGGEGASSRPFAQQTGSEMNRVNNLGRGYQVNGSSFEQESRSNTVRQNSSSEYVAPYGQGLDSISTNQPVQQPAVNTPQVLYIAVPTPDGRGQMLQAVQMVQMPGQPSTFVLPAAHGGNIATHAPMMVLPTGQNVGSDLSGLGATSTGTNWPPTTSYAQTGTRAAENGYGQYGARAPTDDYSGLRTQDQPLNRHPVPVAPVQLGDPIASLYSAPQRPPLDELLGQVRRLSRDQVGCRLLQQALDEEGPMAATLILNEGLSFWGEAMVDPFGNYLFQKILEKITPEERVMLVKSVSTRLVNASLNLHGTRSVQKVVELCGLDEAANIETPDGSSAEILTRALAPAAARLCIDSHGNHVIQRILLKLGHSRASFVFDAVAASVGDVARHRHGCCVIQRCLDSPPSEARSHLVHRIVEKSLDLMQDAYGNYVVQYVLDVCEDSEVHAVCESVVGRVSLLSIQKFSSNVMEKCLERCTDRVKEHYLSELSDPDRIRELMMDPFGNYVVQRALAVATHAQAVRLVEAMRPHLISSQPGAAYGQRNAGGMRNTAGGRRIMAKICRRFPNFTLSEVSSPDELYSQNKGQQRNHRAQPMSQAAGPPGFNQQAHYGVEPHRGSHHGDQQQAYYEPAPPGYYDPTQMHGHPYPSYPHM